MTFTFNVGKLELRNRNIWCGLNENIHGQPILELISIETIVWPLYFKADSLLKRNLSNMSRLLQSPLFLIRSRH